MVKNVFKKLGKKQKNNKGFSLVELIVVIAIMAVLVGVLAPQLIKYVEKSRESTDIQNADSIATAIKTYYSDKETYPASVTVTLTSAAEPTFAAGDSQTTSAFNMQCLIRVAKLSITQQVVQEKLLHRFHLNKN